MPCMLLGTFAFRPTTETLHVRSTRRKAPHMSLMYWPATWEIAEAGAGDWPFAANTSETWLLSHRGNAEQYVNSDEASDPISQHVNSATLKSENYCIVQLQTCRFKKFTTVSYNALSLSPPPPPRKNNRNKHSLTASQGSIWSLSPVKKADSDNSRYKIYSPAILQKQPTPRSHMKRFILQALR